MSKRINGKDYVLYSSDLLRAKHTAELVGRHLGITPIFTEALRERNLGSCVGESVKWMKANIECREKTIDDRMFSDAESRRDEWNRLLPFFTEIINSEHENIIIVSHGDLLSVFNAMWLGMDIEMLNQCELFGYAGGVSFMIESGDEKRFIKRLSDMSFID